MANAHDTAAPGNRTLGRERGVINGVRHFLEDDNLTPQEQQEVLELALALKADPYAHRVFEGPQSVAVLFDKTSTRTRFSFDAGVAKLGGNAIVVTTSDSQMGKGETFQDTGAVLSRFVSMIVWRTFAHSNFEELAEGATVPIVNALSDDLHPCQILADLQTIVEHLCPQQGPAGLKGLRAAYLGDGDNNMANSYLLGMATAGMDIAIVAPKDFQPKQEWVERAQQRAEQTGATITVSDSLDAVDGVDVVITDTWVSMGMEGDGLDRRTPFLPYQVDDAVMARANQGAIFLHCLPAYRGNEVTASVIDGPQSVVFDEAENRLHAQNALMVWLMQNQPSQEQV
ncbi:ornithine carbamoyltransferase [Corynebacterium sp. 153RC1]|uniref:ornithine carbamoyltransferase n=1 Tax=unclassified Corynebacterium TaxID=2624378 RepID=UPI00211CC38D|nr:MULTISPECIES: ornithine carbamoyltransferase [unclassified Corynebacterium]MCQ9370936.1 ornithine carbamoyltransferase [Corynebacterium sp. 35RC1]MCQ9353161.1 ornithine carbamoyltransferase [Corynebacterium sp. 209RC1]MCQ9353900.1 ornithine carbamoyltransferase [Corynebacterium sp. 1222RC1]MCQ9356931.1 ornithine carbamoyltransferase [Corynebacterium sp. 122RC1]MCQ9359737.1 ornithine carbamoyltransferase [Corynebacterium sp. 142RC1]